MSIVVHHLEQSRSHRILWFLEEEGEEYMLRRYARDPITWRAPPELTRIHPRGRAPVVDYDGRILAESGAILETLAEEFASTLKPTSDDPDFVHHRFFLHYAEGSLMSPLLVGLILGRVEKAKVPFFIKPVVGQIVRNVNTAYTWPELEGHAAFLEQHLTAHPWFSGSRFGIADIQMSYPVVAGLERGAFRGDLPKLRAWKETIEARPAYRRAIERGGPVV